MVIPLYMMWEVLFLDPHVHLANPGRLPEGSAVTDLDGAARLSYILSGMRFPWSESPFISSPKGAGIWRLETTTQSIQVIFLWCMSRIFAPMMSGNLLIFIGWFMTGVAVYWLGRTIGGSRIASLAAALFVQLLPNLRFMAANFTSYVFICIPVLVLILTLRFRQEPSRRNVFVLGCGLLFVFLFDPYFSLFSLLIVIILLVPEVVGLANKKCFGIPCSIPVKVALVWLASTLVLILASVLPHFMSNVGSDRSISVASRLDARNSSLNFDAWLFSPTTGVGTVLPLLSFITLLSTLRTSEIQRRRLAVVCGLFFLISTRFSIPGTELIFAPAEILRFLMPGVRFFDRASLVAIPIAVVIGFVQSERLSFNFSSTIRSVAPPLLLLCLLVTSLPNISRPGTTRSFNDWGEIRRELAIAENPRVLALPLSRRGRDWIEQASFQTPLMNDYVESVFDREVMLQASHGPGALAAFLRENGITHLIIIPSELSEVLTYKFESPRFSRVASIRLDGFGEGPDFDAGLYSYSTLPGDMSCNGCGFGRFLIPKFIVSGDLVYPPDIIQPGKKWWWTGSGNVMISSSLGGVREHQAELGVKLSLAPCATQAQVTISSGGRRTSMSLTSDAREKNFLLQSNQTGEGSVALQIRGESCIPVGDFRTMLVQVEPYVVVDRPK